MNILIAGGCDIPPPYGGLAGRILNNAAIWEAQHRVHILLRWAKLKPDLLDARHTRLHVVYPPQPKQRMDKLWTLLAVRLPRVVAGLIRKPALSLDVLRELPLLLIGRSGYHIPTAIVDALTYAAKVDDLVVQHRIDVIQGQYGRQDTLLCEIVAARRHIPVVVESYAEAVCWPEEGEDITDEALYGAMARWDPLFKRTFEAAAHICATSVHCAYGPKRFVPEHKVTVTYPGIDTAVLQRYRERREQFVGELGLDGKKVILYVGQLTPRKGPQFLAMAAPKILEAEADAHIVFVGSDIDGYRRQLEALVGAQSGRVTFTGGVPNETLWKYYAAADALAFPTYTERECLGMSMAEAMAVGTPVVAFRIGGTPEVVAHGSTGYLVEVGDVDGLADRLLAVLRGDLGAEARQRCREQAVRVFDIRACAELELRVLAEAVGPKPSAGSPATQRCIK